MSTSFPQGPAEAMRPPPCTSGASPTAAFVRPSAQRGGNLPLVYQPHLPPHTASAWGRRSAASMTGVDPSDRTTPTAAVGAVFGGSLTTTTGGSQRNLTPSEASYNLCSSSSPIVMRRQFHSSPGREGSPAVPPHPSAANGSSSATSTAAGATVRSGNGEGGGQPASGWVPLGHSWSGSPTTQLLRKAQQAASACINPPPTATTGKATSSPPRRIVADIFTASPPAPPRNIAAYAPLDHSVQWRRDHRNEHVDADRTNPPPPPPRSPSSPSAPPPHRGDDGAFIVASPPLVDAAKRVATPESPPCVAPLVAPFTGGTGASAGDDDEMGGSHSTFCRDAVSFLSPPQALPSLPPAAVVTADHKGSMRRVVTVMPEAMGTASNGFNGAAEQQAGTTRPPPVAHTPTTTGRRSSTARRTSVAMDHFMMAFRSEEATTKALPAERGTPTVAEDAEHGKAASSSWTAAALLLRRASLGDSGSIPFRHGRLRRGGSISGGNRRSDASDGCQNDEEAIEAFASGPSPRSRMTLSLSSLLLSGRRASAALDHVSPSVRSVEAAVLDYDDTTDVEILNDKYLWSAGDRVGRGGEGEVFRVVDLEAKCVYAMKIIPRPKRHRASHIGGTAPATASAAAAAGSSSSSAIIAELQMAQTLLHPHIVKVHEIIDDPTSVNIFLVMDLIEGKPLVELDPHTCRATGDSPTMTTLQLLRCTLQLSHALRYVHRKNVCHRDIKPGNILVRDARTAPHAFLLDFGQSQFVANKSPKNQHAPPAAGFSPSVSTRDMGSMNAVGSFINIPESSRWHGTYIFQSPEVHCNGAPPSPLADMWALGLTLFAARFQCLPFATAPNNDDNDTTVARNNNNTLYPQDDDAERDTVDVSMMQVFESWITHYDGMSDDRLRCKVLAIRDPSAPSSGGGRTSGDTTTPWEAVVPRQLLSELVAAFGQEPEESGGGLVSSASNHSTASANGSFVSTGGGGSTTTEPASVASPTSFSRTTSDTAVATTGHASSYSPPAAPSPSSPTVGGGGGRLAFASADDVLKYAISRLLIRLPSARLSSIQLRNLLLTAMIVDREVA